MGRCDDTQQARDKVIVQIKIKLLGVSKPPVWRLQLPADTRLDHLHDIIVAALGWDNYHMHVFSRGPEEFGGARSRTRVPRRAPREPPSADQRDRRPAPLHL